MVNWLRVKGEKHVRNPVHQARTVNLLTRLKKGTLGYARIPSSILSWMTFSGRGVLAIYPPIDRQPIDRQQNHMRK